MTLLTPAPCKERKERSTPLLGTLFGHAPTLRGGFFGIFWGLRGDRTRAILLLAAMRSNAYISPLGTGWIEGRACPRRYLSVLPSHVRANLFGSD